jgi:hypothetical protein
MFCPKQKKFRQKIQFLKSFFSEFDLNSFAKINNNFEKNKQKKINSEFELINFSLLSGRKFPALPGNSPALPGNSPALPGNSPALSTGFTRCL